MHEETTRYRLCSPLMFVSEVAAIPWMYLCLGVSATSKVAVFKVFVSICFKEIIE